MISARCESWATQGVYLNALIFHSYDNCSVRFLNATFWLLRWANCRPNMSMLKSSIYQFYLAKELKHEHHVLSTSLSLYLFFFSSFSLFSPSLFALLYLSHFAFSPLSLLSSSSLCLFFPVSLSLALLYLFSLALLYLFSSLALFSPSPLSHASLTLFSL